MTTLAPLAPDYDLLHAAWISTRDALLWIDADHGSIAEANPQAELLFGISHNHLCRLNPTDLVPTDTRKQAQALFQKALDEPGKPFELTVLQGTYQEVVQVEVQANESVCIHGRRLTLFSFRDVSARVESQQKVLTLNRALSAIQQATNAALRACSEEELNLATCRSVTSNENYILCWIGWVQNDQAKTVKVAASAGRIQDYLKDIKVTVADGAYGRGPTGSAIRERRPQTNNNALSNPFYHPWAQRAIQFGIRSSLSIPLMEGDEAMGALTVYSDTPDAFGSEEIRLFRQYAESHMIALRGLRAQAAYEAQVQENQQQAVRLQQALEQTIAMLVTSLERRDPQTTGYEKRIADMAARIGKTLGLDNGRCHALYLAGLLHDLGKAQIPAELLNKPGRLSPLELELVKTHAQNSYELLSTIDFPWPLAQIAGQHHERMDGSGYPKGLKGEEILLEARILAVADIIETMTTQRPYRPALGRQAAIDEMLRQRGSKLDAQVVDAALKILEGSADTERSQETAH